MFTPFVRRIAVQRRCRFALALVTAFIFGGLSGSAAATSFSLGHIIGPGTFFVGNNKAPGPFEDRVHFIIDPGIHLVFNADIRSDFWRHGVIDPLNGNLTYHSAVLENADSVTIDDPAHSPYPYTLVTFGMIVLGPGHYVISMFGTAISDVGASNSWGGTVTFSQTPLPASLFFMLTALSTFGGLGLRRMQRSFVRPTEPQNRSIEIRQASAANFLSP
jgi:hypothetical protein